MSQRRRFNRLPNSIKDLFHACKTIETISLWNVFFFLGGSFGFERLQTSMNKPNSVLCTSYLEIRRGRWRMWNEKQKTNIYKIFNLPFKLPLQLPFKRSKNNLILLETICTKLPFKSWGFCKSTVVSANLFPHRMSTVPVIKLWSQISQ